MTASKNTEKPVRIAEPTPAEPATAPATPAPQRVAEPAAPDVAPAIAEPVTEALTVDQAVRALISALGFEEETISGLDIRANGIIRVLETDFGARTKKFTPLERKPVAE